MRALRLLVGLLSISILQGCSMHPVQQNVTGVSTPDLVDYIRCETRQAVQDKAIEELKGDSHPSAQQLGVLLEGNRDLFRGFDRRLLAGTLERAFYDRYIQTGVAFDFTFDITEVNKASANVDPIRLITQGTLGIGLDASAQLNRQNRRHFIISATFETLLNDSRLDDFCKFQWGHAGPNLIYPMSGEIGMRELISTFIDLNEDPRLHALGKDDAQVFADTLTFTTTFDASANPHLVIAPVGTRIGFAPSTLAAEASRTDLHQVIIGLSLVPRKAAQGAVVLAGHPPFGAGPQKSAFAKHNVSSRAEGRAIEAIAQQRYDSFLDKFGSALVH